MIMNGHVVSCFLVRLLSNFLMRFLLWWLVVQKDNTIDFEKAMIFNDYLTLFVFNFAFQFNLIFAGVLCGIYKKKNRSMVTILLFGLTSQTTRTSWLLILGVPMRKISALTRVFAHIYEWSDIYGKENIWS